jgi:hypothetical protein
MSTKEHSLKTHIIKKSSIGVGVAKWIELPSDSRCHSKSISYPLLSNHHIVDHIFIDWTSLIMHGPTSVNKLKLSIFNKFFNLVSFCFILSIPPLLEKSNFTFREFPFFVRNQSICDRAQFDVDIGELNAVVRSIEVRIKGFKPSNVIMRMRGNVNCPRVWLHWGVAQIFSNLTGI